LDAMEREAETRDEMAKGKRAVPRNGRWGEER